MNGQTIINELFNAFELIRYVAVYENNELIYQQRQQLSMSSDSDSDRYEELLVNPTLLTLARQRGNIDCGGLRFLIVGYGNFFQLVRETKKGHISICLEKNADLNQLTTSIFEYLNSKFPGLF